MEPYLVSARKYRPSTFNSVVGQKALTATLKNAVATGRLAHSYLFCGSRGVGKTSCARIFAKTINCEHPTPDGEACNQCGSCRAFNAGTSMNIIELDAASNNGVNDIRELVDLTQNPPTSGRFRVFIVDEVHMLSSAAFNAFLKTLEEPPSYVVFILATTEKHKILPTILSRCQIYDFSRITIQDMIDHLAYVAKSEGIEAEPAALNVIARNADGAMRDALSIFDQVAASSRGHITYATTLESLNVLDYGYYGRLLECFLKGDVLQAWLIYKEIRDKGFDSHFFINGMAAYFRDLMAAQSPQTLTLIEAGDDTKAELQAQGAKCRPEMILKAMNLLGEADLNYRMAANKQFLTELTLARLCQLSSPSPIDGSRGEGPAKLQPIAAAPAQAPTAMQEPRAPQAPRPAPAATPVAAPAAAPTAAPAAQPAAQPVSAAPPRKGPVKLPAMGPRLSSMQKPREAVAQTAAQAARRTAAFTPDDLQKAWDSFIASHPTEKVLVNSMLASRPQPAGATGHYCFRVENEGQMSMVAEALPRVNQYLRDKLLNDELRVTVAINEEESAPRIWNERELLDHMRQNVPELNNFISQFKLTLG